MTTILLLFLIGVVLLAADVFVSSFLLAALGGVVMLGGCAKAYHVFGTLGALVALAAALGLLALVIYLELVVLPRSRFGRGLVVHSTSGSAPPPAGAAEVVGKPATALTTLAPSGYVEVEGRRYDAFCRTGLAAKGASLRVVDVDNFRLIVAREG
jgi:membrane-bound ClpP family serine protease